MQSVQPTVLVVDDDSAIRELVTVVLREAGYAVTAVATGEEALERVSADQPDVVVLDYAMPVVSGRDVLAQLSTMGAAAPPVVVLSASLHAEDCLSEGAAYLVHKPFALVDLLGAIEACLGPRAGGTVGRTRSVGMSDPTLREDTSA
jgi:CheY-like chemotaxis protein